MNTDTRIMWPTPADTRPRHRLPDSAVGYKARHSTNVHAEPSLRVGRHHVDDTETRLLYVPAPEVVRMRAPMPLPIREPLAEVDDRLLTRIRNGLRKLKVTR